MNWLLILLGILALIVIIALITLFATPFMAIFNRATEENPQTHEQEYVTGTLTLSIDSETDTGEVMIDGTMQARTNKPAKFFQTGIAFDPDKFTLHAPVIVIEIKNGIAYVIPNENNRV